MAFEIHKLDDPPAATQMLTATERLWLTADQQRLVPEGHEDAAFLFCTAGQQILRRDALRYGLIDPTDHDPVDAAAEPEEPEAAAAAAAEPEPPEENPTPAKKTPARKKRGRN